MPELTITIALDGSLANEAVLASLHRRVWGMLTGLVRRYLGSAEGTRLWARYVGATGRVGGGPGAAALVYALPEDGLTHRTDALAVLHWLDLARALLGPELARAAELYGARIADPPDASAVEAALARAALRPLVELRGDLWAVELARDLVVCNTMELPITALGPEERSLVPSPTSGAHCRCDMCAMVTPRPEIEASMIRHLAAAPSPEAAASASFYLGNMARPSAAACEALLAARPDVVTHAAGAMRKLAPRNRSWSGRLRPIAADRSVAASCRAVALSGLSALAQQSLEDVPATLALLQEALAAEAPASDIAAFELGLLARREPSSEPIEALITYLGGQPTALGRHHATLSIARLSHALGAPLDRSTERAMEALRDVAMHPDIVAQSAALWVLGKLPSAVPVPTAGAPIAAPVPRGADPLVAEISAAMSDLRTAVAADEVKPTEPLPLSAQLRDWLERDGWPVQERGGGHFASHATGHNGELTIVAYAREQFQQLVVYSIAPVRLAEPRRAEAAELLARLNYGLLFGNFEIDLSDGEVRYKTMLDAEGLAVVPSVQLKNLFMANVHTADRYLPWIVAVGSGRLSALEAAAAAERGDPPPAAPERTAEPSPAPAPARARRPPAQIAMIAAFLARLDGLLGLPEVTEAAVESTFGVELGDDDRVLFASERWRRRLARSDTGMLGLVELALDTANPGSAALTLHVREPFRFEREVLDSRWLAPGAAPPMPQKLNPLPSPGSAPAAFDQWSREDQIEYELPNARITVTRDVERVARLAVDRRRLG